MKIWYIRKGMFETNSSSSHALIFAMDLVEDPPQGCYFGWENFFLRSRKWKLRYFAAQMVSAYGPFGKLEKVLSNVFTSEELVSLLVDGSTEGLGVDHQSVWPRFVTPQGEPEIGFLRDLKKFVVDHPLVAVAGGNDNSGAYRPAGCVEARVFPWWWDGECVVTRNGNYWLCFDPGRGHKMRVTFGNEAPKAEFPESIDLKITSYCDRECPWCYESASRQGRHAPLDRIVEFFEKIKGQVMEVAIGGGEPTLHPDFHWIVRAAKERGIVPNFTTRSISWLSDPVICKAIGECVGGIGFSVCTEEDLRMARELVSELGKRGDPDELRRVDVIWHVVEGITPSRIVRELPYGPLLILGYKRMGRGKTFQPLPEKWDEKSVKGWGLARYVAFDTVFVKEHEWTKRLAAENPYYWAGDDGEFTIAVDLVENRVGRASYLPMKPLRDFRDAKDLMELARE